jgi:hypothetical protein
VYTFQPPADKNWCSWRDLHAHAREIGQRILSSPCLLFQPQERKWSRRPDLHRHGQSRPAGFESTVSTFQPRRDKLVRTEGFAPSRACAHRILAPARILFRHVRIKWSIHRDVRPAFCLTKAVRRFLRVGCKKWSRRKDSHLRSPVDDAFTARCNCCSATPRKIGGSGRIRTCDLLLMRELRCMLRHRAMVGRLGNAPSSAG